MKKRIFALVLAICLLVVNCAFALDVDKAKHSVVRVYGTALLNNGVAKLGSMTYNDQPVDIVLNGTQMAWTGSGFAVGKSGQPVKYFVTNRHCVTVGEEDIVASLINAEGKTVKQIYVDPTTIPVTVSMNLIFTNASEMKPVQVQAVSDRTDLAVLVLNEGTDLRTPVQIRAFESGEFKGGEAVTTIGFPGVADYIKTDESYSQYYSNYSDMTVNNGNVSKIMEHSDSQRGQLVQMTAVINGGNSGGPLFDDSGAVVGVNTYSIGDSQGTFYAVSANEVVRLLDQEKIPYETPGSNVALLVIIIAGVVVAAVAVVVVLNSRKGKKPGSKPAAGAQAADARTLVGNTGALAGQRFSVAKGKTVAIGRDPKQCQIVFPASTAGVSGKHCTVRFDGVVFTVVDEGSSFGTWVDQQKLIPGTPVAMHRGQVLKIGSGKEALQLHS